MNNQERLKAAEEQYDRAASVYYYTGQQLYSDVEFDAIKRTIEELDHSNRRVSQVGATPPADSMLQRVDHRVKTNSLKKCDTTEDFKSWHDKYAQGGELVAELKADGSTLILYYQKGMLYQAVTRGGDEAYGEDITANAVKFKGVPKSLGVDFTGGIRGEVVLMYQDYLLMDPDMADKPREEWGNVRNIGTGMMRRTSGEGAEFLTFLAFNYEAEGGHNLPTAMQVSKESDKLVVLQQLGFQPLEHATCSNYEDALKFFAQVGQNRESLAHKIDGIVFKVQDLALQEELGMSSGCPRYERVLKFEAPGAETTVTGVVLTLGHDGSIRPTADLDTVVIDNTNVDSAQLNNWEYIKVLDIAVGDRVRVRKAKDIIPEIDMVISRPEGRRLIPEPTECPFCRGPAGRKENTDGSTTNNTYCLNPNCEEKAYRRILNWIGKHSILGIGEDTLRAAIHQHDLRTPADLYRLTQEQWSNLQLKKKVLGGSLAKKIVENINKTRRMTLGDFLGGLSVGFLGRRRVEIIRERCPGQMDRLEDWRSDKLLELAEQAQVGNMAPTILKDIQGHSCLIDDLLTQIEIVPDAKPQAVEGGKFSGKSFCFTGVRLKGELLEKFRASGGTEKDSVSKGLSFLVVKDKETTSNKAEKAKKLGIPILSLEELEQVLNDQLPVPV
jgi:DNA ligase (NAD+)